MVDHLLVYDFLLIALLWLGVILYEQWAGIRVATGPTTRKLTTPLAKYSQPPKPFPGLTHKPHCALCEQTPTPGSTAPLVPPPRLPSPAGRPR
jgi:hypothetical protein